MVLGKEATEPRRPQAATQFDNGRDALLRAQASAQISKHQEYGLRIIFAQPGDALGSGNIILRNEINALPPTRHSRSNAFATMGENSAQEIVETHDYLAAPTAIRFTQSPQDRQTQKVGRHIVGQLQSREIILYSPLSSAKGNIDAMPGTALDKIDLQILASLQDDGRMTNVDLAAKVGLTAPPCLRRVRTLEEHGLITSYHAQVDPVALGYTIMVFAMVSLKSQAEVDLRAFESYVADLPQVRECHMLNGEIDFVLKVVSPDLRSFQQLLTTKLTQAPNVASVKTSLTIRTSKNLPGVPIEV